MAANRNRKIRSTSAGDQGTVLTDPPTPIRDLAQWVGWRYQRKQGRDKPAKVPAGSVDDPTTWQSFEDVRAAFEPQQFDGAGFVFTGSDPFTGVDLDGCRDPHSGAIEPWAMEIINDLNSYAEVSPSGTGVKVWLQGAKQPGTRHKWFPLPNDRSRAIEVYDRARYFTWTGQVLKDFPTIRNRPEALKRLCAAAPSAIEIAPEDLAAVPSKQPNEDDAAILRQLSGTVHHRFFIAERPAADPDESASDFQLACELAKVSGNDPDRIERLMRASRFGRSKWERRGDSYLARTIRAAIASVHRDAINRPESIAPPLTLLSVRSVAWESQPKEKLPYLAWAGYVTLFVGREKDGKTTFASWAVVQGALAGFETVWLSTDERSAMIGARFVSFAKQISLTKSDRNALLDRIRVLSRDPRSWDEVEALWNGGWRPHVIVVDTLASFLMAVDGRVPQTSEGEAWQAKVQQFKKWIIGAESSAVVLLTHASKAEGEYRGSTGIGAAPDAIITYRGGQRESSMRRADRVGRFGIGNATVLLRYLGDETPSFEEVEEGSVADERAQRDPFGRSNVPKVLLDLLRRAGTEGLIGAEWRHRGQQAGVHPKAPFNRGRDRLLEMGRVRQEGDRWYAVEGVKAEPAEVVPVSVPETEPEPVP